MKGVGQLKEIFSFWLRQRPSAQSVVVEFSSSEPTECSMRQHATVIPALMQWYESWRSLRRLHASYSAVRNSKQGTCLRGEVRTNLRPSLVSTCAHPHLHMQARTKTYVHYTTHIHKYKRNMFFTGIFSFLFNFQNSSYSVYLYSFH